MEHAQIQTTTYKDIQTDRDTGLIPDVTENDIPKTVFHLVEKLNEVIDKLNTLEGR